MKSIFGSELWFLVSCCGLWFFFFSVAFCLCFCFLVLPKMLGRNYHFVRSLSSSLGVCPFSFPPSCSLLLLFSFFFLSVFSPSLSCIPTVLSVLSFLSCLSCLSFLGSGLSLRPSKASIATSQSVEVIFEDSPRKFGE